MRKTAMEYIRAQVPDLEHDYELVVQIYSNLRGLVKAYSDANVIYQRDDLDRFIRGFNMSYPLFSIIDAGNGKECSDAKLRGERSPACVYSIALTCCQSEVFKLHVGNAQCKHIVFGGSSDNGYARLLVPYSGEAATRQRITMLEGPPFAPELSRLTEKFNTAAFPAVFRDSKIEATPQASTQYREIRAEPSSNHLPQTSPLPAIMKAKLPIQLPGAPGSDTTLDSSYPPLPPTSSASSQNWRTSAVVNGYGSPTPAVKSAPPAISDGTNTVQVPDGCIAMNSKGERVDPPLKVSTVAVNKIKPRKMCNHVSPFHSSSPNKTLRGPILTSPSQYHLRKSCHNPLCAYEHGEPLEGPEKDALKFLARQFPCENEIYCEDGWCMFGHRCTAGSKCNKYNCRFSDVMHGVDEKVANFYEGSQVSGY